ncbi:MAG: serine/threonine protein kinase [Myxococcales bacterium]|nr:serine/threonine protein kinase [Myxococcales bacterium]
MSRRDSTVDQNLEDELGPLVEPLREIARYVVMEELGAGAMGVVYRAHDPDLGRQVAIKLVHAGSSTARATRLLREAQAIARVAHPNIVAIHDVGIHQDQVFICMELVEGPRLRDWMAAGPRTLREILGVFEQAARGLAAAHDAGLVHRDFKPENVLVGDDGRVRVVDFGLVRWAEGDDAPVVPGEAAVLALDQSLTPAGAAVGTPRYMSPEQIRAGAVGPTADQFAFGVCLYEALSGQRPFLGDNMYTLMKAVAGGELRPWPPGSVAPRWLRALVERALAVRPADRWPSMHAIVTELTRDRASERRAALDGSASMDPMIAAFPPPDDLFVARKVEELRGQLERAWAHKSRGALPAALKIVAEVGPEIERLGYRPLRAAMLYLRGNLQYRTGDALAARATLLEAAREAARAGDDWQVANVWTFLVLVVGLGLKRFDEAEGVVAAAEVALERVGENASLRSRLLNNWGTCLLARGRALDAADCFTRAVELDTITHGAGHGFVAVSLLHLAEALLAAQRLGEAASTLERAWALCQPDRLTPTPTRLRCQALVGRLRIAQGRPADAVGPLERAILGWERLSGRERALGETVRDLAAARRALGDAAAADVAAERAARLLAVAPPRTA